MDWNLLGLSFIIVFLAELGDKSQLAAITLSGQCRHPRAIFLGTASALVFASFLGVVLGGSLAQFLPTQFLKAGAAIGFAILGISFLWDADEEAEDVPITSMAQAPEPDDGER